MVEGFETGGVNLEIVMMSIIPAWLQTAVSASSPFQQSRLRLNLCVRLLEGTLVSSSQNVWCDDSTTGTVVRGKPGTCERHLLDERCPEYHNREAGSRSMCSEIPHTPAVTRLSAPKLAFSDLWDTPRNRWPLLAESPA